MLVQIKQMTKTNLELDIYLFFSFWIQVYVYYCLPSINVEILSRIQNIMDKGVVISTPGKMGHDFKLNGNSWKRYLI